MRISQLFIPTLFEEPQEAEAISHKLMLRAAMIRRLSSGVYSYLPLGLKALHNMQRIIREEMETIGCQEVLLPGLTPASLWQETGRWDAYGEDMFRLKDRKGSNFALGPTHEEIITDLVRREVKSYRQLPVSFYQIQTKFRDEPRPRFGTIRAREFLMKDAYSFHRSDEEAVETYMKFYQAYERIFTRCGFEFKAVEADSGLIGGNLSHEFIAPAAIGEDTIVECSVCKYAANQEKAECGRDEEWTGTRLELKIVNTPSVKSVAEVSSFLGVSQDKLVKTIIYQTEDVPVAVLVRGDKEINENKLKRVLGTNTISLADAKTIEQITNAPTGFAGPIGLKNIKILADYGVKEDGNFVVGGNKPDSHFVGANQERDFEISEFADIRAAGDGDKCPQCGKELRVSKGIELGHTFNLGTKYSKAMNAAFTDETGKERIIIMGCYGIGVSRLIPAYIEQHHDASGIIWNPNIAPYQAIVLPLNIADPCQFGTAEGIYYKLQGAGISVLLDDRDERPGRKFTDAELLGIPIMIVIGAKTKASGNIEISWRRTKEKYFEPIETFMVRIKELLGMERIK
ncbi:MAG: proline--tRNA ligase [bacterium]